MECSWATDTESKKPREKYVKDFCAQNKNSNNKTNDDVDDEWKNESERHQQQIKNVVN